ncbi:MAG: hypothetical protein RJA07_1412 [Bacteroidota bacterium]|jgi:leucyl-tRNA synthetase
MELNFANIEEEVKKLWAEKNIYRVENKSDKPKYYVLEMFPYPSGAGLHVGHPLGYIASDIFARYKRHKGFNVLHPMGYDAFGLPAEQYAIETGQHPAVTTEKNIARYREQLDKIGLSYDWSREFKTSDPKYYKWTQWIFIQIFNSWFNRKAGKAEHISTLIEEFEKNGNANIQYSTSNFKFLSEEWKNFDEKKKTETLMQHRLAYLADAEVNWCEALGTVLANDEVVNGVSERGGHPVVKKKMRQWFLRITEYADRLLQGLETLDWSEPMKEMQRNWIGRSEGASIKFSVDSSQYSVEVFTTRPDTIFGCSFMVIAPENDLVNQITTAEQKAEIEKYVQYVKSRSDVERMAEKKITGCFTGAFALHPFTQKPLPIYVSEYVLNGYGTGAIMAVPAGDSRDYAFAKHFNLPIPNIFSDINIDEKCYEEKTAVLCNSDFLNGMDYKTATQKILQEIEAKNIGQRKINFRMRDAGFSRQRYWGEPFPIYYENGIAKSLPENELPLELPHVASYSPGPEGQGPLANIKDWTDRNLETNTMPGYAGSSWYFLRYMSPQEDNAFVNEEAMKYWGAVDFYLGGSEHAVGHLLYSRMWTKVLHDLGFINFDEPFKKLVNQGMIIGVSWFTYVNHSKKSICHADTIATNLMNLNNGYNQLRVPIDYTDGTGIFNLEFLPKFLKENDIEGYSVIHNDKNELTLKWTLEKMSKSKKNVVTPDEMVEKYGADTFRMYEMFLGPIELSKPWDTKGIEGVSRFLRKFWNLFFTEDKLTLSDAEPTNEELKILHQTIKKIDADIQKLAYNTCVSQFMICVNELQTLKCNKRSILQPLLVLLNPFAPFITEFLWKEIGNKNSVIDTPFPTHDEKYLVENSFSYPIAINGKTRINMEFALDTDVAAIEKLVLENEQVQKFMEGKPMKKFIFVKGRMVNVVV